MAWLKCSMIALPSLNGQDPIASHFYTVTAYNQASWYHFFFLVSHIRGNHHYFYLLTRLQIQGDFSFSEFPHAPRAFSSQHL